MVEITQPTKNEIRAVRATVGDSQAQAAAKIRAGSYRAWQEWEAGNRAMHPGLWELYLIKSGLLDVHSVLDR